MLCLCLVVNLAVTWPRILKATAARFWWFLVCGWYTMSYKLFHIRKFGDMSSQHKQSIAILCWVLVCIQKHLYCVACYRCRSGSLPAIGETEPSTESIVDKSRQSVTSSLSRQSNDSAYDSMSLDSAGSPRPSLALRHLIRSAAHPSHVTVRTGSGSHRPARCLHLAAIPASMATGDAGCHMPAPPSSGSSAASVGQRKTQHGSAQRFRNMVLECRDGD